MTITMRILRGLAIGVGWCVFLFLAVYGIAAACGRDRRRR